MITYFTSLVERGYDMDLEHIVAPSHIYKGELKLNDVLSVVKEKVVMVQADGDELDVLLEMFPDLPKLRRADGKVKRVQRFTMPWAQLIVQNL